MSSAIAALSKRVAAANMELADVGGIVWLEHINLVIADKVRVRAGVRVAILPLDLKIILLKTLRAPLSLFYQTGYS